MQIIQKNEYSTQLEVSGRLNAVETGGPRAGMGNYNHSSHCRHNSRLGLGIEVKSRERLEKY